LFQDSVIGLDPLISVSILLLQLNEAKQAMESIYSKAKVCSYTDKKRCNISLEPDLTLELQNNRDPNALKYYWLAYRNSTGRKMPKHYTELANIINEAVVSGGSKLRKLA
jgi:peptidyl-dipeptidase A/DNA-directed RNA polymerase III subunit RPC1